MKALLAFRILVVRPLWPRFRQLTKLHTLLACLSFVKFMMYIQWKPCGQPTTFSWNADLLIWCKKNSILNSEFIFYLQSSLMLSSLRSYLEWLFVSFWPDEIWVVQVNRLKLLEQNITNEVINKGQWQFIWTIGEPPPQ